MNGFNPKTEDQVLSMYVKEMTARFVSYKNIKKFMADLKLVYKADTEELATAIHLSQISFRGQKTDIYYKFHREFQTPAKKSN